MSPRGYVDLHLHTLASDGVLRPRDVVAAARRARLEAIAITDHDTIEGLDEARAAVVDAGLRLVSGVEISTEVDGVIVHVLGYLFDAESPGFRERLSGFCDDRRERAHRMVEKLVALGAPVRFERVLEIAGDAAMGRPHVAEALLEAGHVKSFQEAFHRFIGAEAPAYVGRNVPTPAAAIELVRQAGGVTSLAHPGSMHRDDLIPAMVEDGLTGIEVWHPRHDARMVSHYRAMARELGVCETGGSDYHGGRRGDAQVGDQPVPARTIADLEARTRARAS